MLASAAATVAWTAGGVLALTVVVVVQRLIVHARDIRELAERVAYVEAKVDGKGKR